MEQDISLYNSMLSHLGMSIESLLVVSIALIITIASYILALISSIKLYKKGNIPGSGKLLIFLAGSIIITFLGLIYLLSTEENEIFLLEESLELVLSVLMAIGAYGFLQVRKHIINE